MFNIAKGLKIYYIIAVTWYVVNFISKFIDLPTTYSGALIVLVCCCLMVSKPLAHLPFCLLLLSTVPVDEFIYAAALLAFVRVVASKRLLLQKRFSTCFYLLFVLSTIISATVGSLTVEFRPWQALFWFVTFLVPFSLPFFRLRGQSFADFEAVSRFALFLIVFQILLVVPPIVRGQYAESPDFIQGTWGYANVLGFWASTVVIGVCSLVVLWKRLPPIYSRWQLMLFSVWLVGMSLTWLASAKIISLSIFAVGIFMISIAAASSAFARRQWRARLWLTAVCIGTVVLGTKLYDLTVRLGDFAAPIIEQSNKVVFLQRVFVTIGQEYNHLFGVGPGMLGSKAANAVSADIMFKDRDTLLSWMANAPPSQRWALEGLYQHDFAEKIKDMSAMLVTPFSGLGSVKGELGWSGLLLASIAIIALAIQTVRQFRNDSPPLVFATGFCIGTALLATLNIAIYDTVWELPRIMVFLGALCIALPTKGPVDEVTSSIEDSGSIPRTSEVISL